MSERSRIMELEREVADLQLRLRASQQKEDAVSLSQQQISSLKAQAQSQEKKVCGKLQRIPSAGVFVQLVLSHNYITLCACKMDYLSAPLSYNIWHGSKTIRSDVISIYCPPSSCWCK